MSLTVKPVNRAVVSIEDDSVKPGWERWFLLTSDQHHDNANADHHLELKHLKQADSRDAQIISCGDTFCCMQGRWDKRADASQLRPELVGNNYLDAVVKYNAEFYKPFANRFVLIGRGNHETAMMRRHETDLTERLVERLNATTGSQIIAGGYSGFVHFAFRRYSQHYRFVLYYHHGAGGGGPVTKGVIQTNRQAVYLDGVDIVVNGHTHDQWLLRLGRMGLNHQLNVEHRPMTFVRVPGYQDGIGDGYEGWQTERWMPPKTRGAAWLRFWVENKVIHYEITMAQ